MSPVYVLPPGPHPAMPNVADLAADRDRLLGQVAALTGYLDRALLGLARAHGTSVDVERLRLGLPARAEVGR